MERGGLILLVAALMVYMAPHVHGTNHLSFANNTQVNITRTGCGVAKLCLETPNNCDPAGNTTCLFGSAIGSTPMAPNGTNVEVELRGESTGYIAVGFTANVSEGSTLLFVCAQNSTANGSFLFRTMLRNNIDGALTSSMRIVRDIRGMVNGNVIQCEFTVPNVNATSLRSSHFVTFNILVGFGTFDGNVFGPLTIVLNSGAVNVVSPGTTANPGSTVSSGAAHPHAMLALLSVVTGSVFLRT